MSDKNKFILANPDIDSSFLTVEMTWDGVFRDSRVKEYAGMTPPNSFAQVTPKRVVNTYAREDELVDFVNNCAQVSLENKGLIKDLRSNTEKISKEIINFTDQNINRINDLSQNELAEKIEEAKRLQSDCAAFGTVVAFADVFEGITGKLVEIVKQRSKLTLSVSDYVNLLSEPEEESLTQKAYSDISKSSESNEKLSQDLYWLNQGYIGRGITADEIAEIKELESKEQEKKGSFEEVKDELELDDKEVEVAKLSQDIVFTKSLRADVRQYIHVFVNRIVDRLAVEWGIPSKILESLTAKDLIEVLREEKKLPSKIHKRIENAVFVPKGKRFEGYDVYHEPEASSYIKERVKKDEHEDVTEISGQIAQPGIVQGKIKLVFGPQHMSKVEEGDILVSPSTSPQLLPAMKRAAAFVTDIGGITSHAAIVAREMKKPCIVGTKNATQILKDDMLVEVDATHGKVNII